MRELLRLRTNVRECEEERLLLTKWLQRNEL